MIGKIQVGLVIGTAMALGTGPVQAATNSLAEPLIAEQTRAFQPALPPEFLILAQDYDLENELDYIEDEFEDAMDDIEDDYYD